MKTKIYIILIISFATIMLSSCGDNKIENNQIKTIEVQTVAVASKNVNYTHEYPGTVQGSERVKLSTKLMGTITYLPFEIGQRVNKGEVVAKISSNDILAKKQQLIANRLKAKAAFANVEVNYFRVKALFENKSATQKELDDISMAYEMAKAQLKEIDAMEAELNDVLKYSVIRAPFDGYIANKMFEQGDLATPGYPLVIFENLNSFEVRTSVSAPDLENIKIGDSIKVLIPDINKFLTGVITEINQSADPFSKQFQVVIQLPANNYNVKSGMYAKININNGNNLLVTIDKTLLVNKGQLTGVYTVNSNGEALLRWLRLGKDFGDSYEVLSGLSENDLVIVNHQDVEDGLKVEVL